MQLFMFLLFLLTFVTRCGGFSFPEDKQMLITQVSVTDVMEYLGSRGYQPEKLSTGSDTDTVALKFRLNKVHTLLFVRETTLQLYAAFKAKNATLEKANSWNRDKRFSRTYLDKDGDPVLEADLDVEGGVTVDNINNFLDTFALSLAGWIHVIS